MKKLVSICMPAYLAASYCPQALTSVGAQKFEDWELLVVEDGSNDGTDRIVQHFARSVSNRVFYERNPVNRGVSATRNRLLEVANGDWVAWLDADDRWRPDHLAVCLEALNGASGLCVAAIEIFYANDAMIQPHYYFPSPECFQSPISSLFGRSFIQTSSCILMTRDAVEKAGKFDENLRIGEDRDFWFRGLLAGVPLRGSSLATVGYRKHPASSMVNTMRVAADTLEFYQKYRDCGAIPEPIRRRHLCEALLVNARLERQSNPQSSCRNALKAVELEPLNPLALGMLFAARITAAVSRATSVQ